MCIRDRYQRRVRGACYGASVAATFLGIVVAYESPAIWARGGVLVAACVIEACFGFYYPALAALHSQYTSIEGLRVMCVSLVRCLSYIYALVGLGIVWYTGSLAVYWVAIAAALFAAAALCKYCLLYTSDAADEEDSVDLGGRRIIKKKNSV
eukprot:TRINITY_DN13227_c0_g1_i2.p1 TRINITY_DN13227_c0_g1~~TRINITY_DN13227_c0_g1_i2.p1  ORF type:complete len:152 (-),score=30.18 TRINITY_DN13227_c0_g1_i2:123-578(-)